MDCRRNTEAKELCARLPDAGQPGWELMSENDQVFLTSVRRLIEQGRDVSEKVLTWLQAISGRTNK